MTTTTMPTNVRTFRQLEEAAGGRSPGTEATDAWQADPFRQTRYQFARLTALSVTALALLSAVSVLAS